MEVICKGCRRSRDVSGDDYFGMIKKIIKCGWGFVDETAYCDDCWPDIKKRIADGENYLNFK